MSVGEALILATIVTFSIAWIVTAGWLIAAMDEYGRYWIWRRTVGLAMLGVMLFWFVFITALHG